MTGFTTYERRALSRKRYTETELMVQATAIAIIIVMAIALVRLVGQPTIATAKETTPREHYPRTNAGSCMMIRDGLMGTQGAAPEAFRELCKGVGVELP